MNTLTKNDLLDAIRQHNLKNKISGYSRMRKDELLTKIGEHMQYKNSEWCPLNHSKTPKKALKCVKKHAEINEESVPAKPTMVSRKDHNNALRRTNAKILRWLDKASVDDLGQMALWQKANNIQDPNGYILEQIAMGSSRPKAPKLDKAMHRELTGSPLRIKKVTRNEKQRLSNELHRLLRSHDSEAIRIHEQLSDIYKQLSRGGYDREEIVEINEMLTDLHKTAKAHPIGDDGLPYKSSEEILHPSDRVQIENLRHTIVSDPSKRADNDHLNNTKPWIPVLMTKAMYKGLYE